MLGIYESYYVTPGSPVIIFGGETAHSHSALLGVSKLTDRAKRLLDRAALEANNTEDRFIGSEHLLLAMAELSQFGMSGNVLTNLQIDLNPRRIREEIKKLKRNQSRTEIELDS